MRKFSIAAAFIVVMCAPVAAQDITMSVAPADVSQTLDVKPARISAFKMAMSEVVILRYRAALKLTAAQEKYWPAVASALRALAREPSVTEAAVRRFVPAVQPLLATMDDSQKQVAMGFAQKAGLTQYASLF